MIAVRLGILSLWRVYTIGLILHRVKLLQITAMTFATLHFPSVSSSGSLSLLCA